MSLPRVRFTLRRLMLVVALVALPLAAVHLLSDEEERCVTTFFTSSPRDGEVHRAVRVATDAVGLPFHAFSGSVTRRSDGWIVVVDVPGDLAIVVLDHDFKVQRIKPGE